MIKENDRLGVDRIMLNNVILSAEEKENLCVFLEQQEGVPISVHEGIRELWYQSDDRRSELRLLFLFNHRVTVSRVEFINRRKGTMTKVMSYLEDFCKRNNVAQLVVQSAETPEIVNWCVDRGFEPDPNSTFVADGILMGDYIKKIQ